MKLEICQKCEHFVPHYNYTKLLGISKISCGHCKFKKRKSLNCDKFKPSSYKYENEISLLSLMVDYDKNFKKLINQIGDLSLALLVLKDKILPLLEIEQNKKEP